MRQKIKRCLTEEKGSITLLVLSTMLFICVVLALSFTAVSNKTSAQMKEIKRIEAEYESNEDIEVKYNEAIKNSGPTTVTYNYSQNGGQSATASVKNVYYGSAIDLTPTASKSGYNFVGWNTDSNATTALTSLKMGDESVTLYAIYSKTVTGTFYYYNGTQSTSRTVSGTMYNNATTISIKSPTISSFTKDSKTHTPRGWSTSSSGSATISVSSGANVSLSANRTYYASYTYPITLTYNANGGSGGPTSQSGTAYMNYSGTKYNGSITLSTSKPTRTYYTFEAWYTSSTGGTKLGTTYSISSDTTIYAHWSGNVYTVTLNNQSATSLGSTAVYEKYNTGIYKELACTNKMETNSNAITKPTKSFTLTYNANGGTVSGTSTTASYTFGGYYTSSGGSGTQLINSNGYITSSFSTTRYTSNTTLYAKWTRNTISLATPTRAGYTFKGWYTSDSGGTRITSSSTITASRTIYAQWESNMMISGSDFKNKMSSIADTVTKVEFLSSIPDLSSYTLNTNKWDVSEAQDGRYMAWYDGTTLKIGGNGKVVANYSCYNMFNNWSKVEIISFGNNFDTSNATNMSSMFYNCKSLTSLDVSNFNTSNVTNISRMFYNCSSLTSLDVSNFNTSNVTSMGFMFCSCSSLTSLDVSNFNTSNVTSMLYMFNECRSLTSLNVSKLNTNKVTDMGNMFSYCKALTSLDVSNFNTSNVTDMNSMFDNCSSLTSLNVSNFNTSNVTNISRMFYNCSSLTSLNVSSFNTSNVKNMFRLFYECESLTSLNVSNFNTSNVTNMNGMFAFCSNLANLNLGSFNTSKVTDMGYMFVGCSKLSATMTLRGNVTSYTSMFSSTSTQTGAKFTLNYTSSTSSIVDSVIATKSSTSNVVKGSQVN